MSNFGLIGERMNHFDYNLSHLHPSEIASEKLVAEFICECGIWM